MARATPTLDASHWDGLLEYAERYLSEDDHDVIGLVRRDGLTQAEAAAKLGMTTAQVAGVLARFEGAAAAWAARHRAKKGES